MGDGSTFPVQDVGRWFAVKTQASREFIAAAHLRRQDFVTFLPLVSTAVRWPTRMQVVRKPFFPGYLFVRLDLARDRWRSINGTVGVVRLVQFGDAPSPAPRGLIESMQALTNDHGELQLDDPLMPGSPVRVVGGPFDRMAGVFQGREPAERVRILISMLSREVLVTLPRATVMSI